MRRAILGIFALALGVAPVAVQAHGPGAKALWDNFPWENVIHTHCTTAANANEFFITVPIGSVGVGKHSQAPTTVDDWYLIIPGVNQGDEIHAGPHPQNQNPCFDSQLP